MTISLNLLFKKFSKIGFLSFGGPAAQIALMHKILVEEEKWLKEKEFLSALSFCMLLPGPEAMQLATYAGWQLRGIFGGLIAGLLFVLPGAFVVLVLSILYLEFGQTNTLSIFFTGIKAAVLIIVFQALVKVAQKTFSEPMHYCLALASFIGIFFFNIPFPLIIIAAALTGYLTTKSGGEKHKTHNISPIQPLKIFTTGGLIWIAPLILIYFFSDDEILIQIWLFFSQLAVVTFGGAYAVLAYMTQAVVGDYGWMTSSQMIDALGLAETTPGPLILVTQFVGFFAAASEGSIWFGIIGATLTLWVTFVPCFIWIFAGAPYISWLSGLKQLSGALTAISAAVVGVIANLSIWFAMHALFQSVSYEKIGPIRILIPEMATINVPIILLTAFAAGLIVRLKVNVISTLILLAIASYGLSFTTL